jgi:hypothetical protein
MIRLLSVLRVALIVLTGFLALSAVPGGITLLAGIYTPPVEQLKGSVFSSFLVPGLALLVVVGGGALLALVLLIRGSRLGLVVAGLAGAFVMVFEFVEVLAIGSPPGPAFVMQVLYFGIGLGLVCLSLLLLPYGTDTPSRPSRQ